MAVAVAQYGIARGKIGQPSRLLGNAGRSTDAVAGRPPHVKMNKEPSLLILRSKCRCLQFSIELRSRTGYAILREGTSTGDARLDDGRNQGERRAGGPNGTSDRNVDVCVSSLLLANG